MNLCLVSTDVIVGGIDIGTRGAQVAVEGQGLVDSSRDMQEHIFGYSPIVGIEIAVVPLVGTVVFFRPVAPVVVTAHGYHILSFLDIGSQVESASHHAVLTHADCLTVEIEVGSLSHSLKLNKHLFVLHVVQVEMFPVPDDGVGQVNDVFSVGLVAIEGVGQCHPFPL